MDFSEMSFLDESNDLDQTLMKAAMDFVNSLSSKIFDENSMVPEEDEDIPMDTAAYYNPLQQSETPQVDDEPWILQINSPPAPVPSLDEKRFSVNAHNNKLMMIVPVVSPNHLHQEVRGTSSYSPDEQRVPNDATPVHSKIDLPRAPKRKIFELYRNNFDFHEEKENISDKPRIIMKFCFDPPPNPIPNEIHESVSAGRLANASLNTRADMLFNVGFLPTIAGSTGDYSEYEAISRNLYIDQKLLRRKINSANNRLKDIRYQTNLIDLDKEYNNLLLDQLPHLTDDDFENDEGPLESLKEIFELDGTIYLKLRNRELIVPPVAVLVCRMLDSDIEAIRAPPKH